ncbi:ABC transporter ATP-binding protein [Bacillus suaedaesalsae]|uniref:ATP-binding cassette domain-containing protein n=1 Tax=Bacillus suaedaesalsae TaxID=2810349 RepID=A0ABS2DGG6_9BACI|nr:ATP-binding cassette domain-containing protein [Bacillus suaedaesalsae]MBM6617570.1 ATP-binding cassette domain-containing protein [Bacillus suaedaesalsae]
MIKINNLTKVFPNGKGIFDVSFEVNKGEVFGYLGPNGAGKSTTIRQLLGFSKPTKGKAFINELNVWKESGKILKAVGYLPGEIAFLEGMTGYDFIVLMEGMRGTKERSFRNELIERFQFDPKTPIRKMSKGMKQKVAIVTAFMHNPEVLILDEPTSGLDPLMQRVFIELILEEKKKGKTILMSSHSFQEIERTCDVIGIIKDGSIVAIEDSKTVQGKQRKVFDVQVQTLEDREKLLPLKEMIISEHDLTLTIAVTGDPNPFIQVLSNVNVTNLSVRTQDLEELFMHYYDRKGIVR